MAGPRRCAIDQDQPDPPVESVLDVLVPAMERCSALADELAGLLVRAGLFS